MSRNKRAMKKTTFKRSVNLLMTAAMLTLMSYSLIGEAVHEWIGIGMAVLFVLHLALNWQWVRGLGKGRWPAYRILQAVLAGLCLLTMLCLMTSGIILSRHVFSALRIRGLSAIARQVHMAGSFWGFVFMSLHLGLHWGIVLNAARSFTVTRTRGFRALGWLTAAYGAYAFWRRGFPGYLLLRTHFLFLDYEEPILFFFLDYLAIMGLFVFCAYYGSRRLLRRKSKI